MSAVLLGAGVGLVAAHAARHLFSRWPRFRRWPLSGPPGGRWVVVAALVPVAVVAPPLAALVPLAWWSRRHVRARRAARAEAAAVSAALPDLVDLLGLACSAGLSLPVAHPLVAAHTPSPLGPALLQAHATTLAGRSRADALAAELAPFGDRARALGDVLVDHLRYGVPLLPGLERAGLELRLDRRRRAEVAARRVPVRLLAPLVTCVLPAFSLLTVVPLLAASLDSLPT